MNVTFDFWSALVLLGLVLLVLTELWAIVPQLYGLPWRPARRKWIRRALELARVQPGETVYDLGAGDGRVLVIAAREFQARAVGIEIEPVHCVVAWLSALLSGVIARVTIKRQNFMHADLSDADVVYLYAIPTIVERLRPLLKRQLRPGARVVSLYFDFKGWQPADIDIGHLIFLYQMPPEPGSIEKFLHETIG